MKRMPSLLAVAVMTATACSGADDDTTSQTAAASSTPTSEPATSEPSGTDAATVDSATTESASTESASTEPASATSTSTTSLPEPSSEFARAALAPPRPVEALWTYDAEVLSQLTVGDDWVAVAVDNGQRQDVVLDLATGEKLWSKPASASAILSGLGPIPPVVIGDTFVHLAPTGGGSDQVRMSAVDVRTGEFIWRFDRGSDVRLTSAPFECDNGNICGSGFWAGGERETYEINVATGEFLTRVSGAEGVAGGVEMQRSEEPERFMRTADDGTELWAFELDAAFERDVETSKGWSTDLVEDDDVFVAFVPSDDDDFANDAVIGVDYSTGERRWIREGRSLSCWESLRADGLNAWCAHTGSLDLEPNDPGFKVVGYTEVTTIVEVFDPATGETLGALDVEPTPGWDGSGDYQIRASRLWYLDGGVAAASGEGVTAIDFDTGETVPLPAGQLGWCEIDFDPDAEAGRFQGYNPCVIGDNTRAPVDEALLPASVIAEAGAVIGDTVVIVQNNIVQAYRYTDDT